MSQLFLKKQAPERVPSLTTENQPPCLPGSPLRFASRFALRRRLEQAFTSVDEKLLGFFQENPEKARAKRAGFRGGSGKGGRAGGGEGRGGWFLFKAGMLEGGYFSRRFFLEMWILRGLFK